MLLHSNNLPIRVLGLGPTAYGIRDYLIQHGQSAHCMDFQQAFDDEQRHCYQYLIGSARVTPLRIQAQEWLTAQAFNRTRFIGDIRPSFNGLT